LFASRRQRKIFPISFYGTQMLRNRCLRLAYIWHVGLIIFNLRLDELPREKHASSSVE